MFVTLSQWLGLQESHQQQTIQDLPLDIVHYINDFLSLADTAALALTSKHFSNIFSYTWVLLNASENKEQRLRFLRRFDALYPTLHLCKACAKYYPWPTDTWRDGHTCWQSNALGSEKHIQVCEGIRTPASMIELVQRHRHYDWPYSKGRLPIKRLQESWVFEETGWHITTDALFNDMGSLLLKITSTCDASLLDHRTSFNTDTLRTLRFCGCADAPSSGILRECRAAVLRAHDAAASGKRDECIGCDWHCQSRGAQVVIQLLLRDSDKDKTEGNNHSRHNLIVNRWHNLGPASQFGAMPVEYWNSVDRDEVFRQYPKLQRTRTGGWRSTDQKLCFADEFETWSLLRRWTLGLSTVV